MDEDLCCAVVMTGATVAIAMLSNHLHLLTHSIQCSIVAFDLGTDAAAAATTTAVDEAAAAVEMKRATVVDSSNLKTNANDVHFADERLTVLHLLCLQSYLC